MTIRDRIMKSAMYLEGLEFTTARANTQLKALCKQSIGRELRKMSGDGELVSRVERRGSTNIAYYKKPEQNIRHMAWVSTPTTHDFTPRYC